ncbi:MAG: hypothetical protein IJH62_01065 [Mogibacterium sp.]|nr:hypothetical protein [Mogibacterium sp.]
MNGLLAYAQENSGGTSTISFVFEIAAIVGLWMMFTKMNEDGWKAIIPFYNQYKLCEKTMGDPWYWVRLFVVIIPFIGWIAYFYFKYQIGKAVARSFGQADSWAWGYTFLEPVFYCITGFGQYNYYGVMGSGDTRTGDARVAKTVDFDVTKTAPAEPVVTAAPADPAAPTETVINAAPAAAPAEPKEVEFEFDPSDDVSE